MKFALFSSALLATGIAVAAEPVNGMYMSAFGGYTYLPSNINTSYFGPFISNANYTGGYNVGGRIGYQTHPVRYEFEYTYLTATLKRFDINRVRQNNVSGDSTANLLMANLYYDFPNFVDSISPFLGVGIGYALMQTSLTSNGPFYTPLCISKDRDAFAYQGTAGLTYNFSENYAINAAYRYTATANSGPFGKSLQAQMGNFGVIYRFDTVNYK